MEEIEEFERRRLLEEMNRQERGKKGHRFTIVVDIIAIIFLIVGDILGYGIGYDFLLYILVVGSLRKSIIKLKDLSAEAYNRRLQEAEDAWDGAGDRG